MELFLKNITKTFHTKKAITNFSLTLKPGIYSLLGQNGAGKTTLMEMLVGNLKSEQGEILYNKESIYTLKDKYFTLLGYLPQELGLPKEMSVQDYLEYMAALKGLSKKESKVQISSLLQEVTLFDQRNQKIFKLSGGMKRRLGIAQALLGDPKILILDEPTSGLDPKERIRFKNLLTRLSKERIVIISTHIVSDVESLAQYHVLIHEGKLILVKSQEELLKMMEKKVWQVSLKQEWDEKIGQMVQEKIDENGNHQIRYLASNPFFKEALAQKPCLEDVVFWILSKEKSKGGKNNDKTFQTRA